jgi:hypothetical protein
MVGSNQSDSRSRILKIDRTSPHELNVVEHEAIYSKQEISDILSSLHEGNRLYGGLKKVLEAYGIVGEPLRCANVVACPSRFFF